MDSPKGTWILTRVLMEHSQFRRETCEGNVCCSENMGPVDGFWQTWILASSCLKTGCCFMNIPQNWWVLWVLFWLSFAWGIEHHFPDFIYLFSGLLPVSPTRMRAHENKDFVFSLLTSPGPRTSPGRARHPCLSNKNVGAFCGRLISFDISLKNDFVFK